jgi:predicted small lipoprotein YifL
MRKIVMLLVLVAMLQACGLKGPLYLSPPKPAAKPPAAAAPAPAPAVVPALVPNARTDDTSTPAAPVSK